MAWETVVGGTRNIHVRERAPGRSLRPTTSAETGAMVVQKVPARPPPTMELEGEGFSGCEREGWGGVG